MVEVVLKEDLVLVVSKAVFIEEIEDRPLRRTVFLVSCDTNIEKPDRQGSIPRSLDVASVPNFASQGSSGGIAYAANLT